MEFIDEWGVFNAILSDNLHDSLGFPTRVKT